MTGPLPWGLAAVRSTLLAQIEERIIVGKSPRSLQAQTVESR